METTAEMVVIEAAASVGVATSTVVHSHAGEARAPLRHRHVHSLPRYCSTCAKYTRIFPFFCPKIIILLHTICDYHAAE
jgi:hypothetical protein